MNELPTSKDQQNLPGLLKILWVEDMEDDVVFGERELKKAGLKFQSRRVETREDFTDGIHNFHPDVILSDHGLPQFNSSEAFKIYKALDLPIPFILVTGTVSEEFAVSSLKLGIDDYVVKTNLSRLPSAILNSLNQRRNEKERKVREEEITKQNQKLEEDVQRRTQEAINEKSFTDSIVNNMPGLFYVIGNNRIYRWNDNLESITGYTAKEIGQLNPMLLIPEKERDFASRQFQATITEGTSRFELTVVTKSGDLIPHYFTGHRTWLGETRLMVAMGIDISDLKNTQETLRLHDERMELAFSTSGNSWWDWEITTGKVESHPNRYLTLGYTVDDMKPRTEWWTSLIHPDDKDKVVKDMEDCLTGRLVVFDTQCRLVSKDGEWKWFQVFGKVVTRAEGGAPLRMIGTADNITKNKLIEQELIEAKFAAESANRTKGQFLANMSHEIRTPLNAVIGLSHLARKTELTPKQQDYLKKIQSSSESLLAIINDILDFSKVEAGRLTLEEVGFDLEEVLQKVCDVITYKAYGKGLEVAFGIDSDVFTHLNGDPVRLEQILTNLCSNAVKFTDTGEVVVVVKRLEESDNEIKLQFEVSDTGIGMDKQQLGRLFMPFSQADESISRKFGGTGLGLSIIKKLVELMDGKVWVQSKPGKGSTFYCTARFRKQMSQCKLPVPTVDLRQLNVLLVDDNASATKILKDALESFSFDVTTADSGLQAIHFLKNHHAHEPVKLALIDWKMPEMDGIQTAEIIRQDPLLKDIRIIMMCTSYANEELYQQAERLGVAGILIKPIRYSSLYDTIMGAIDPQSVRKKTEIAAKPKEVSKTDRGHVLLVEDNEINQQVAGELLQDFGYTYEIANNGVEAIRKVRESGSPSRYDLVLMDLQMPIMGGYKATEEIRRLDDYKKLPIIAMTADAMGGVREKCIEVGMMDFITKPVNPVQMEDALRKWITTPVRANVNDTNHSAGNHIAAEPVEIPSIDGVDVAEGLSHVNGNSRLLYDLLIKFRDNHHAFVANVKKAFAEGEETHGRRLIHTMKGMSANLGMMKLNEETIRLEQVIHTDVPADLNKAISAVAKEMDKILASLKKKLVQTSEPAQVIPMNIVKPLLLELNRLLKDQDLEAMAVLKKIGVVKGLETQLQAVEAAVRKYDFELAAKILDEMEVAKLKIATTDLEN